MKRRSHDQHHPQSEGCQVQPDSTSPLSHFLITRCTCRDTYWHLLVAIVDQTAVIIRSSGPKWTSTDSQPAAVAAAAVEEEVEAASARREPPRSMRTFLASFSLNKNTSSSSPRPEKLINKTLARVSVRSLVFHERPPAMDPHPQDLQPRFGIYCWLSFLACRRPLVFLVLLVVGLLPDRASVQLDQATRP